jgi:hypothetical protein
VVVGVTTINCSNPAGGDVVLMASGIATLRGDFICGDPKQKLLLVLLLLLIGVRVIFGVGFRGEHSIRFCGVFVGVFVILRILLGKLTKRTVNWGEHK